MIPNAPAMAVSAPTTASSLSTNHCISPVILSAFSAQNWFFRSAICCSAFFSASSAFASLSTWSSVRTVCSPSIFSYSSRPVLNSGISSRQLRPKIFWAAASLSNASPMCISASPVSQNRSSALWPFSPTPRISSKALFPLSDAAARAIRCFAFRMASTGVSMKSSTFCIRCRLSLVRPMSAYWATIVCSSSAHSVESFALDRTFFPKFTAARAPLSSFRVMLSRPSATVLQATFFPIFSSCVFISPASLPALSAPLSTSFSSDCILFSWSVAL